MPKRTVYDKSHFSFRVGDIGRLRCLSIIPVVAGESVELDLQGVFRLSPLRRNLTVDCMVDFFAFYRPYRHTYGDLWLDFIRQGVDESVTFPTYTLGSPASAWRCFPQEFPNGRVVPRWLPADLWSIWNRYFRPPADAIDDEDMTTAILNTFYDKITALLGPLVCWPKAPWNTDVPQPGADDRRVALASNQLDILDLSRVKKRYKTELDRQYFGERYNDLLDRVWDVSVNIDADQRPELLARQTSWLSGYDTDGTAADNLGEYAGKSAAVLNFGFPRKHFAEHGSVWVLCVYRWPLLIYDMINPILQRAQPSYKWLAGDPDLMMGEPPESLDMADWSTRGAGIADPVGAVPYGMHHRYIPSVMEDDFRDLSGFPFLEETAAFAGGAGPLIPQQAVDRWSTMFRSTSQRHWQCQARLNVRTYSPVPGVLESIYAGTR